MSNYQTGIAWAAGVFEGEGCFVSALNNGHTPYPKAAVKMTDEDTVRRFGEAVGFGYVTGPHQPSISHWKRYWAWHIHGFEKVQALYAMFYPWLSQRRKARGAEVLRATPPAIPPGLGAHNRWHVNRKLTNKACPFCEYGDHQ